jgi:type I restriction-modification system DNA methylase subunit
MNDFDYDFGTGDEKLHENVIDKLFKIVIFDELLTEDKTNIVPVLKDLWYFILSQHPSTKQIFLEGKSFDIRKPSTYTKLIQKIAEIQETDFDILGGAYESLIKDTMTGKVLGQFFTPPCIKKLLVQLVNPSLNVSGEIESCCDLTMGTAGLLSTYLNYALDKSKVSGIHPNWEQIKGAIYGKEIEPDTYQLAMTNMFISTGHMFTSLELGDSIRSPITRKFKNVVANMPFGIKGLKYEDIDIPNKKEYLPIQCNSAVPLFLQVIIHILEVGGTAAVVLPDGQDLFGKQSSSVAIREYLMKTCDLKEIIYFPAGVFEYTSIKTCVAFFKKKLEGSSVITIVEKGKKRDITFTKPHSTKQVKFYDYNTATETRTLLIDVPIEKVAANSYSLNYAEYMKDETEEEYEDGVVVKTLGEVCEVNQGNSLTKTEMIDGIYDVIGGGKIIGKHNQKNRDGNDFTLTRVGDININYIDKPYYLTDNGFSLKSKQEDIMTKYIYYLLSHNKDYLTNLYQGTAQKVISKTNLKSIKIPIPSLERQQEIVTYLDFIYERANKTSNEKIAELKKLNEFCMHNQKIFGENDVKTLGEVCEKIHSGKFNSKDCKTTGKYPFYTNKVNNPEGYTDEYCFDYEKYFILIKDGGAGDKKYGEHIGLGKVFKVYGKSAGTSHQYVLIPKKDFDYDYLYQYLKFIKNDIMDLAHYTTGLGCIKKGDIESLKIPIPSLERQKEIVDYCEYNDKLIKQLETEIENNKKQAQLFMNIVKVKEPANEVVKPIRSFKSK